MDEKQSLLRGDDQTASDSSLLRRLANYRPKYIEVAFFVYYIGHTATLPLVEQFVHAQIHKQQEVYRPYLQYLHLKLDDDDKNNLNEVTNQYGSCKVDNSSNGVVDSMIEQSVQSKSSSWLLFIDLAVTVPAVFSTLFICSYSDIIGRKLGIALASFGSALRTCIYILTIYFQWSPVMYVVGTLFDGLSGSTLTFFGMSCAYVADTSSVERRAFRFVILQTLHTLANALANILIGYVIDILGYTSAFWIICAIQIINSIYIVIGVPDSKPRCQNPAPQTNYPFQRRSSLQIIKESTMSVTKKAISSFLVLSQKTGQSYGRLKLSILLAAFLCMAIIVLGIGPVQTLFMLAPPICWNSILIGYYNAINHCLHGIVGVIGVWVLTKVMKDATVAIIGSTSHVLGKVIFGLAKGSVTLYLAIIIGMGDMVVFPLIRALMSRIVGPAKQGALFATIFCLETIMDVCSGVAMNAIYMATLSVHPGIVFFVGAAMCTVTTILIGVYYIVERRTTRGSLQHLFSQTDLEQEIKGPDNKDSNIKRQDIKAPDIKEHDKDSVPEASAPYLETSTDTN